MYLPNQEDEIELRGMLDKINNVLNELRKLELAKGNRVKLEAISKEFNEKISDKFIKKLLEKEITECIKYIDNADFKWVEDNISYIKKNISQLSIEECESWRLKNRDIPLYLKDESLVMLKEINNIINDKIKNSKVDGIIAIFKELDEEEKQRCLMLLHGYV